MATFSAGVEGYQAVATVADRHHSAGMVDKSAAHGPGCRGGNRQSPVPLDGLGFWTLPV